MQAAVPLFDRPLTTALSGPEGRVLIISNAFSLAIGSASGRSLFSLGIARSRLVSLCAGLRANSQLTFDA